MLRVAAGTDDRIACRTRAHTSRLRASVAVARLDLGIKLGVQQLDNPAAAIAEAYQRHCVDLRDLRLVGRFD